MVLSHKPTCFSPTTAASSLFFNDRVSTSWKNWVTNKRVKIICWFWGTRLFFAPFVIRKIVNGRLERPKLLRTSSRNSTRLIAVALLCCILWIWVMESRITISSLQKKVRIVQKHRYNHFTEKIHRSYVLGMFPSKLCISYYMRTYGLKPQHVFLYEYSYYVLCSIKCQKLANPPGRKEKRSFYTKHTKVEMFFLSTKCLLSRSEIFTEHWHSWDAEQTRIFA